MIGRVSKCSQRVYCNKSTLSRFLPRLFGGLFYVRLYGRGMRGSSMQDYQKQTLPSHELIKGIVFYRGEKVNYRRKGRTWDVWMCTEPDGQIQTRRFGALGGGGRRGTALPDKEVELPLPDPNKLGPALGFLSRPGIAIENVCPSLSV